MDRRNFIKNTGWSFLGLAASGSLLGSCAAGSKEAKKKMPSASDLKMYWGDLHNHCNITYGHGDMRDAFEAAKGQLDFVSVTPQDRKSTRLNSSHPPESRMPSSA